MFLVPLSRNASELSRGFDRLFDDNFFDRVFSPAPQAERGSPRSPALDVAETERDYTVTLDLPGMRRDDVKVTIDGRRVSIEAQASKQDETKEGDRVIYRERASTSYARSFMLPAEVDQSTSSATLEHGVLTLTLAKRGATTAQRIEIK